MVWWQFLLVGWFGLGIVSDAIIGPMAWRGRRYREQCGNHKITARPRTWIGMHVIVVMMGPVSLFTDLPLELNEFLCWRQLARRLPQLGNGAATGSVTVVSGPSGVGKGTLLNRVLERIPDLEVGVSWTTRDPRPGDKDGFKIYRYVTRDEFLAEQERGGFMETAEFGGNLYGTHVGEAGTHLLLEIEVQGAQQIATSQPHALLIGILPPGESPEAQLAEVTARLRGRRSDDEAAIRKRLATAPIEMETIRTGWLHIVINDDIDRAEDKLVRLIEQHLGAA